MKTRKTKTLVLSLGLLVGFVLWTVALRFWDVQAIGPRESAVGLATLNRYFHHLTGVHMTLYVVTDWRGLVPFGIAVGFAVLGLAQWIRHKHILRVDYSILTLGGFYLLVIAAYLFFEQYHVNYRPVLINGYLEVSFPSSTTLLVMSVMPTTAMQAKARIKHPVCRRWTVFAIAAFTAFMVAGRTVCGVHWLTDIIGGGLLSNGLVGLYAAANERA